MVNAAGHSAREVAQILHGDAARESGGWWRLRGVCHGGDAAPPSGGSLGISDVGNGAVSVNCWKGCDRKTILAALERETGLKLWGRPRGGRGEAPLSSLSKAPPKTRTGEKRRRRAISLWRDSKPVPKDASHPVRLWAERRGIWPAGKEMPQSIRWRARVGGGGGVGELLAAFAAPEEWELASLGESLNPSSVELQSLSSKGDPALDKPEEKGGLRRRTLGGRSGCLFLVGEAVPEKATGVAFCEGVADALALAAHSEAGLTAVAFGGTGGIRGAFEMSGWIRRWKKREIYADSDDEGRSAARELRTRLALSGIELDVYEMSSGGDPAGWSELRRGWGRVSV